MTEATGAGRLHACPNCGGRSDLAGECRDCRRATLMKREMRARTRPALVIIVASAQIALGMAVAALVTAIFLDEALLCLRCQNVAGVQSFVVYLLALPVPAIALGVGMLFPSRAAWVLSILFQIAALFVALVTDAALVGDIGTLLLFIGVPVAFLVCLVLPQVRAYYAKPEVSEQDVLRDDAGSAA